MSPVGALWGTNLQLLMLSCETVFTICLNVTDRIGKYTYILVQWAKCKRKNKTKEELTDMADNVVTSFSLRHPIILLLVILLDRSLDGESIAWTALGKVNDCYELQKLKFENIKRINLQEWLWTNSSAGPKHWYRTILPTHTHNKSIPISKFLCSTISGKGKDMAKIRTSLWFGKISKGKCKSGMYSKLSRQEHFGVIDPLIH